MFNHLCSHPGNFHKASDHLEVFHQLARKQKWHTESGDSLYEIACGHLRRVYTNIAEQVCIAYSQ